MKKFFVITTILVSVLALLISPLQVVAQNSDPESVLRAVFGALNNKDIAEALELVADDATITIVEGFNQFVFTGKEEIRGWWELVIIGENSITLVGDFLVDGDKAIWSARVSNDPWNALNVSPVHCHAESVVQDGLLKSHTFILSAESIMKIRAAANKEIARRFLEEIWNQGNMAAADELIAEDFVNHAPSPGLPANREGLKQDAKGLLAAFSAPFTIDDLIAEGDKVVMRGTFRSVHNGEFLGVPATGKELTHTWTAILRIKDGKIVERWANVDSMKFMTDLGILPAPGEGGK